MDQQQTHTVVEVNGVKLEVDLRTARRVEELRVGSKVKVLTKDVWSDRKVFPGVVVGFEPFKTLPTIIVCYLVIDYNKAELRTVAYNAESKDVEIVASIDDVLLVDQAEVTKFFDREQAKLEQQIADLQAKRDYFVRMFGAYFPKQPEPALPERDTDNLREGSTVRVPGVGEL